MFSASNDAFSACSAAMTTALRRRGSGSLPARVDARGKSIEVRFFVDVKQSLARTTISHHEDLREFARLGGVSDVFEPFEDRAD